MAAPGSNWVQKTVAPVHYPMPQQVNQQPQQPAFPPTWTGQPTPFGAPPFQAQSVPPSATPGPVAYPPGQYGYANQGNIPPARNTQQEALQNQQRAAADHLLPAGKRPTPPLQLRSERLQVPPQMPATLKVSHNSAVFDSKNKFVGKRVIDTSRGQLLVDDFTLVARSLAGHLDSAVRDLLSWGWAQSGPLQFRGCSATGEPTTVTLLEENLDTLRRRFEDDLRRESFANDLKFSVISRHMSPVNAKASAQCVWDVTGPGGHLPESIQQGFSFIMEHDMKMIPIKGSGGFMFKAFGFVDIVLAKPLFVRAQAPEPESGRVYHNPPPGQGPPPSIQGTSTSVQAQPPSVYNPSLGPPNSAPNWSSAPRNYPNASR